MDREKVIDGLEKAKEVIEAWIPMFEQRNSPFTIDCAIELLKEQQKEIENLKQTAQSMIEGVCLLREHEAVKPVRDELTGRLWLCGKCGSYVGFEDNDPYDPNEYDKYCRECSRPVLWEGR